MLSKLQATRSGKSCFTYFVEWISFEGRIDALSMIVEDLLRAI